MSTSRSSRSVGLALCIAAFLSTASAARAAECGGIGGTGQTADVTVTSQASGVGLPARVYAPQASRVGPLERCPLITMLPGGGAQISSVEWAALRLSVNGYVVIVTDPASPSTPSNYDDAAKSAVAFMRGAGNPFPSLTDTQTVGGAGWSLGGRALTKTQEDPATGLAAIVAWDNLAISETGDAGSPSCDRVPDPVRTPVVPAMGQASEECAELDPNPELKKTAFAYWRVNDVPTYQVVFRGCAHQCWSNGASTSEQKDINHYYTQAWFDRWLKDDSASLGVSADDRLRADTVLGVPLVQLLSAIYRSAAAFDGFDCSDLRSTTC